MPNSAIDYNFLVTASGPQVTAYNSNTGVVQATGTELGGMLNQLMALLPSSGGFIKLTPDTFIVTTAISVPLSNVTIAGSGSNTIIQVDGSKVTTALKTSTTALHDIIIKDLNFQQTNATPQGIAVDLSNTSFVCGDGLTFTGFATGIKYVDATTTPVNTAYGIFINIAVSTTTNPILVQALSSRFDNLKLRPLVGGAGTGVTITYSTALTFIDVDIEATTTTGLTGISIDANSVGINIESPYITGLATGISIASGATATSISGGAVTGNTADITDNTTTGTIIANVKKTSGSYNYSSSALTNNSSVVMGAGTVITQTHGAATASANAGTIAAAYGEYTTASLTTAAGAATATQTITDTSVLAGSKILFNVITGTATAGVMFPTLATVSAGSFTFTLVNVGGATANGTYIVQYLVV